MLHLNSSSSSSTPPPLPLLLLTPLSSTSTNPPPHPPPPPPHLLHHHHRHHHLHHHLHNDQLHHHPSYSSFSLNTTTTTSSVLQGDTSDSQNSGIYIWPWHLTPMSYRWSETLLTSTTMGNHCAKYEPTGLKKKDEFVLLSITQICEYIWHGPLTPSLYWLSETVIVKLTQKATIGPNMYTLRQNYESWWNANKTDLKYIWNNDCPCWVGYNEDFRSTTTKISDRSDVIYSTWPTIVSNMNTLNHKM